MKRSILALAVTITVSMLGGCHTLGRQPRLVDAAITPDQLKPGDTAIITVKVKDPQALVDARDEAQLAAAGL